MGDLPFIVVGAALLVRGLLQALYPDRMARIHNRVATGGAAASDRSRRGLQDRVRRVGACRRLLRAPG